MCLQEIWQWQILWQELNTIRTQQHILYAKKHLIDHAQVPEYPIYARQGQQLNNGFFSLIETGTYNKETKQIVHYKMNLKHTQTHTHTHTYTYICVCACPRAPVGALVWRHSQQINFINLPEFDGISESSRLSLHWVPSMVVAECMSLESSA